MPPGDFTPTTSDPRFMAASASYQFFASTSTFGWNPPRGVSGIPIIHAAGGGGGSSGGWFGRAVVGPFIPEMQDHDMVWSDFYGNYIPRTHPSVHDPIPEPVQEDPKEPDDLDERTRAAMIIEDDRVLNKVLKQIKLFVRPKDREARQVILDDLSDERS